MPTKRQHYVPCVYMKAWETTVETKQEPDKKFEGIYIFKDSNRGEGVNRNSILWKPHLYTVSFNYLFIAKSCPNIYSDFVDMIYSLMKKCSPKPVYGKLGYNIIRSKKNIRKHLFNIDDWVFYYEDGNIAKQRSVKNQIEAINSYVLESAFDDCFEKQWEQIYNEFIDAVHSGTSVGVGMSERIIPGDVAIKMCSFFLMMLCRSPQFNAMGIYTNIKNNTLYPIFIEMYKSEVAVPLEEMYKINEKGQAYADELMTGIWYSEIYKMLFRNKGGFYNVVLKNAIEGCQMILFEAYPDAGIFITSDNPAFEHISFVERENSNGFIFPITPKYLFDARINNGHTEWRFQL